MDVCKRIWLCSLCSSIYCTIFACYLVVCLFVFLICRSNLVVSCVALIKRKQTERECKSKFVCVFFFTNSSLVLLGQPCAT